jgi:hypothetical protein
MNIKHFRSSDLFKKAVQSDIPAIAPDAAIEQRLNYYFNLQHSRQKIHANGFSGFFGWIFSTQALIFKTGFIVIAALFLFIKSPVTQDQSINTLDTCISRTTVVDTNSVVKDTCIN